MKFNFKEKNMLDKKTIENDLKLIREYMYKYVSVEKIIQFFKVTDNSSPLELGKSCKDFWYLSHGDRYTPSENCFQMIAIELIRFVKKEVSSLSPCFPP